MGPWNKKKQVEEMRHENKSNSSLVPNAARSQIAEGYLRAKYGDRFETFSAGTEVSVVSPYAIRVMEEFGIDISRQRSKSLDEFDGEKMDVVVTVCDNAKAVCPFFPGAKKTIHMSFPDPKGLTGSDDKVLEGFRTVRDAIARWIDATFGQEDSRQEQLREVLR